MWRIIKIILVSIIVIGFIIGGAIIFLLKQIDRSAIKDKVTTIVAGEIGRPLRINGSINLSFFPWVGVKISGVALSHKEVSLNSDFANIGEVDVGVKLFPLLHGNFEVDHLLLKDFNLWLVKNSDTSNNWQDLAFFKGKESVVEHKTKSLGEKENAKQFSIASLDISNANIFFFDRKNNQHSEISKLNLKCKDIMGGNPFAANVDFYWKSGKDLRGEVAAKALISADFVNKLYSLRDFHVVGKFQNNTLNLPFDLQTNAEINLLKQIFTVNDIGLHVGVVSGSCMFRGDVRDKINFSGECALQNLNSNINNFSTKIAGDFNTINLHDIKFNFHGGKASGNAAISLVGNVPRINLSLGFGDVNMQGMLKNAAKYDKLSGNLTLNTNLSLSGTSVKDLQSIVGGGGKILITNGVYHGLDIPFEVRRASALINHREMPHETQPPHTNFDSLTANFRIDNSIISTNDLAVQAPDYSVTGQGSVNLSSEQIDFKLSALSTHDKNFFVPIKISGALNSPSIRPDVAVLLQNVVKKEIQKELTRQLEKQHIPEKLLNLLPGSLH